MKILLVASVVMVYGLAMGKALAEEADIVIRGNAGATCVAKEGGVCNQSVDWATKHYHNHTHKTNIDIHGNVAAVCSSKTGGTCNMGGTDRYFSEACIQYMDNYVWCN